MCFYILSTERNIDGVDSQAENINSIIKDGTQRREEVTSSK